MKNLSILFGAGVGGIVVCLVMTIYTSIQENRIKNAPPPFTIPTPAISQH